MPQRGVEVDDRARCRPSPRRSARARTSSRRLGLEHVEQAHRAALVAQQLAARARARERLLALQLRAHRLAQVGLRGDRVAHLAEGVGDRLLVSSAASRWRASANSHAAADLAARPERLGELRPATFQVRAGPVKRSPSALALAAVEAGER